MTSFVIGYAQKAIRSGVRFRRSLIRAPLEREVKRLAGEAVRRGSGLIRIPKEDGYIRFPANELSGSGTSLPSLLDLAESWKSDASRIVANRWPKTILKTDDLFEHRALIDLAVHDDILAAVTAYIDVVRDEANVRLTRNNEKVLEEQLRATNDRFEVGEVTRTDVAQAQARVARAKADRLSAEGALAVSGATYERVIGNPPQDLADVPPLPTVPSNREAAIAKAVADNPQIDRVKFSEESAGHNVRVEFGGILPTLSLVGSLESTDEQAIEDVGSDSASLMLRGTIPLYQSGVVHSQVRQAKELRNQRRIQIEQARRAVIEQATQAWEVLGTATSNVVARQSEIDANEIALEGVKEEATVGSRTVLDVLDAEQELLDARVAFIFAKRNEYVAAYSLLSAVGDLTAVKLQLPAKLYDPSLHYNAVRDKWFGWEIPE